MKKMLIEGYEKYFALDKQNQIEGIINGDNIPKVGMNQITVDAIKNMVDINKKEKKAKKRKEKNEN